jgi:putative membrane protein
MFWLKAFHIIFFTSWFAGLFYLPRLFVYHAMTDNQETADTFKIMERKLYNFVTPFMWITIALGLWMMYDYAWEAYKSMGWLHAKLVIVTLLVAYHFYCGHLVKVFRDDQNRRSHVFYRFFNEMPVLCLFAIVILAVLKPF